MYRERDVDLDSVKLKQYKRDLDAMSNRRRRGGLVAQAERPVREDPEAGCASDRSNVKEWMKKEQEALYDERIRTEVKLFKS